MSYYNSVWNRAEPKYRGLRNQGSTCYLNSVLQVLFMTKEFRDAVQSESSHTSYIDAELKDLFLQLKTGSPTTGDIIRRLGIENVWKQQDAAEYFEKMLSLASREVSQVFHGRLIQRMSCSCGQSTDEHNSFWTLNLPINNAHNGVYSMKDGLKRFFSQSKLTGDNQVYCDECEVKADSTTECEVELYPKVLVLLLKRFEFSYYEMDYVKNDCPVDVPLKIEIPKSSLIQSYELYATVDHVGNLSGGHYTATIQSPDDRGSWYKFNDSTVTPKNNFNPIKSQSSYLLFYRKTQMSDSPQEDHHGSSVDPAESETNQNNADDGYADHDSDDRFHTPPSSSGSLVERPVWAGKGDVTGGDEVTKGVVLTERADVTRADDVRVGVDVTKYGEVTEMECREPADHPVPQEASGLEGVDVPECGEVTGGDEVVGGDPQPTESERVDGKSGERIETDVEVPTNEKESHEPGDHAVQQEASSTAPMVSGPEVVVIERWENYPPIRRESTDRLEDPGEGEKEGDVLQKTEDGNTDDDNADHDGDSDANHTPPSSSEPMVERPVWAGRVDVTGGDEVTKGVVLTECADVTRADDVRVGVDVTKYGEVTEMECREPADHPVPQEASSTAPIVSGPEVVVIERWRGRRESTDLLEDPGEGEKEGDVLQKTEDGNTDDDNADHDGDSDANHTPPSSSEPMVERPVWAGRVDVTGGGVMEGGDGIRVDEVIEGVGNMEWGGVREEDDAMECGDVGAGDEVVAGYHQPMEVEGLDGKGGESMTTGVEVPTNEKESHEPDDHAVQPEASGTGPIVSDPEGSYNERGRGQRESTGLLEVSERGATEVNVIQKKQRHRKRKWGLGNRVDDVKEKQSIKKTRKPSCLGMCLHKQTSDTE